MLKFLSPKQQQQQKTVRGVITNKLLQFIKNLWMNILVKTKQGKKP